MSPRRLLPLLAVFVVLAAAYFGLDWHTQKKAREAEEALRLFPVKEADITAVTLKRGAEDIRLVREGATWRLTHPLKDQADAVTMSSLLAGLTHLRQDRDLGPTPDLKPFGLEQPALVVTFTAGEKSHTLALGNKVPGERGYYARRDQDPRVLVVAAASKESLDRPLNALRNRALFDFSLDKVKALKVKTPQLQVVLEKSGASWRWPGRDQVTIHPDRLERLLRYLSLARVKDFVKDSPQDLRPFGLAPPALEVTVVTDKGEERLALGARQKEDCYARKGEQGPLILMENLLLDLLTAPLESVAALKNNPQWAGLRGVFPQFLEDRRLWTGEVNAVAALTWGPPGQTWSAVKDKDFFQLTGPEQKELRLPAVRVELALLKLRDLEGERLAAPRRAGVKAASAVELKDAGGLALFRLEELGGAADQVEVRFARGAEPPREALVPKPAYDQWRQDLERLTSPPAAPGK